MKTDDSFIVLNTVDSTNNYAMESIRTGRASHGTTWFSSHQTNGKGSRGHNWLSQPGMNMAMSLVIKPKTPFRADRFHFNAFIALLCVEYLKSSISGDFSIKWPNDIYWNDRKAGGILIENLISGTDWNWSVIGIGININQIEFHHELPNPISLKKITGKSYDPESVAREINKLLLSGIEKIEQVNQTMPDFNSHLYKKGEIVRLKEGNKIFSARIDEVNEYGQLITTGAITKAFSIGDISWI